MTRCPPARIPVRRPRAAGGTRTAWALLLAGLALLAAASAARAESVSEYDARLSLWSGLVSQAHAQSRRGDPAWRRTVEEVSREASERRQVSRADGSVLSVSHPWLRSRLGEALAAVEPAQRAASLETAVRELAFYRAALAAPPAVDRAWLRGVLAEVVPVATTGPTLGMEWLQRLARRLMEWLDRLSSRLPGRWAEAPRVVFWVVVGLAAAVLGAGLGLAVRALVRRTRRSARTGGPTIEAGRPQAPPDADSMLARARQAAAKASYREAIRYLYLSLVLKLDLAGLATYDPSKTNWEFLRSLDEVARAGGELRSLLTSLTAIFDRTWYGLGHAGAPDYERCERLFGDILASVGAT